MKDIIQCSIPVPSGGTASLGDILIVKLPEIDRVNRRGDVEYWVSEKTIKAKLGLRLSRGLVLRVIDIIDAGNKDDDSTIEIGSVIGFKRFSYEWGLDGS